MKIRNNALYRLPYLIMLPVVGGTASAQISEARIAFQAAPGVK